jgi:hypothetical protein
MNAKIGEIWLVTIPLLTYDDENNVNINLQKRPCLIIDDGRGLIVEQDNRNFHILKLTTQYDKYKRKLIKNWEELGLKEKSYIRIEFFITKLSKTIFEFFSVIRITLTAEVKVTRVAIIIHNATTKTQVQM